MHRILLTVRFKAGDADKAFNSASPGSHNHSETDWSTCAVMGEAELSQALFSHCMSGCFHWSHMRLFAVEQDKTGGSSSPDCMALVKSMTLQSIGRQQVDRAPPQEGEMHKYTGN